MRCAIPTCDSDHSSSSEILFHRLPEVRFLYAAWEKAFSKAGLRLEAGSVVCSKHFLDNDLFDTTSGRHVRSGALPIVNKNDPDKDSITQCNVKVCRICFSMDCKLYSMTTSDTLKEAYEQLTALSTADEEHLPRYLCRQCANSLMECERFRSRSLRAHVLMLDVIRRHGAITIEFIQSMIRNINPVSASQSHNYSNDFDFHNGQLEGVYTSTDAGGDTRLDTGIDENIDDIKTEIDYAIDLNDINGDDITNDDVDNVKTEIDDLITQDNVNSCPSNVDEDIDVDVVTNAPYDATSEDDRSVCSSNDEEDVVVDDEMKLEIEEDNISNDDFKNGETNDPLAYSAGLYEHTVGNVLKITLGDEPDYGSSEEASNNIHSFSFVGEDVLWNSVLRVERQEVGKPIRVTKRKKKLQDLNELATEHQPLPDDGGPSIGDVLRCDICSYHTVSDIQLLEHLKAHAADGSFMCDVCGYKTTSKNVLGRHIQMHSRRKLYSCKSCTKGFSHEKTLNIHMKEHLIRIAGKRYLCDICDKLFSEKHIIHHLKTHSSNETIICDICGKKFMTIERLERHKGIHTDEKPYLCDICNQGFSRKSNVKLHMRIHLGEYPYSCEICKKDFSQNIFLRNHLKTHFDEYCYTCDVCKKKLRHRGDLTRHMRIHTGEKSYSCKICKQRFSRKSNVNLHMRIHSGERPYSCDVCKKTYSRKYHLIDHMRIHFGKLLPCNKCKRNFTSKSKLKIHMRNHLNRLKKRSFLRTIKKKQPREKLCCRICNKLLSNKNTLNRHLKTHSSEKPFSCDVCKNKFWNKSAIYGHITRLHLRNS